MGKILITGASGFVGSHIAQHLLLNGGQVVGTGTSFSHPLQKSFQNFEWVCADTTVEGRWQEHVSQAEIIINLTGKSIFSYWTRKYKRNIYNSRILTTRNIINAIEAGRTKRLLSASAVGIYGDGENRLLSENTPPGTDFLAQVCVDWEKEAVAASQKGVDVIIMRLGVVLGNGGALSSMVPVFKYFMGGPLGTGMQWFPWIHINDLVHALCFIIEKEQHRGCFNFVGPEPLRQKSFARELGRALSRPSFMPAPKKMVHLLMGELGRSLLQSQKALPDRLIEAGYPFLFTNAGTALDDILGK